MQNKIKKTKVKHTEDEEMERIRERKIEKDRELVEKDLARLEDNFGNAGNFN